MSDSTSSSGLRQKFKTKAVAEWQLPPWYLSAYSFLVLSVFLLIALGGSVRVMKAGLACPDWPLCFGDFIPDYHPQVYFEFMHRAMAGLVACATFVLQFKLFRSQVPRRLKILGAASLVLLLAQIIYGGLTVILLLKAHVVVTHLFMGTAFFSLLLWIYLSLRAPASTRAAECAPEPEWLTAFSALVVGVIFAQILLGGMVAANFASLVCTDFPTCHGEWFPTFRGIIGMHVIHRMGAYFVFLVLLANWWVMRKFTKSPQLAKLAALLFAGVCGQVALGVANVLLLTPPLLAVGHLALAVALLSLAWRQLHYACGCTAVVRASRPVPSLALST